jgi:beta-N-acetylhexosaminidase
MDLSQTLGQKLLLAFEGKQSPSKEIIQALKSFQPAGITLFRSLNIENPPQVRSLTEALQRQAKEIGLPPLLIATDQEGGQLMAVGEGTTHLPGNMALGASGSVELARRAGEVLGRELAAMGINVDYAPCADVNVNPNNPVVGIRSFGEDPEKVAQLTAAMVAGIQSQGVAATAKHFPGHGDVANDSHYGLPTLPHSLERLQKVELPPFRAAISAGTKLIMTAHISLPALDGPDAPPATLSRNILQNLLRRQLGFEGVIVTDAMDMRAIRQGEFLGQEAIRAAQAGADLLLLTADPKDQERVANALAQALKSGELDLVETRNSIKRILELKRWLSIHATMPELSVLGCAEHAQVAQEIAENSITLVRDRQRILPIQLNANQRIALLVPEIKNLTPADTSSYLKLNLADALREYHPYVDEFVYPFNPQEKDIAALLQQVEKYALVIIGTLNAYSQPGQQALVHEVMKRRVPTIVVAMRLPYDLAAFPEVSTYLCTYSIVEPSMQALAKAMFGFAEFRGRLPVTIPGLQ